METGMYLLLAGLRVAEPVLKDVCMWFSELAHLISHATMYMQRIQRCVCIYTQTHRGRAAEKGVGGVTQAL